MALSDQDVIEIIKRNHTTRDFNKRPITSAEIKASRKLIETEHMATQPATKGEIDTRLLVDRNLHSYNRFLWTTRKLVDRDTPTHRQYLQERKTMMASNALVTATEQDYIMGRKLWTDAVSAIDEVNKMSSQRHKQIVIARLKKLEPTKNTQQIEKLYKDCILYMQENSVLTLTFKSEILNNLTDFQPLNIFENNTKGFSYSSSRDNVEQNLFQSLPQGLKSDFIKNKHARPRYGAIRLKNRDIGPFTAYGDCMIVFKPSVKHNSLYMHENAMGSSGYGSELASYHHPECILSQFDESTAFEQFVNAVQGKPNGYSDYFNDGGFEFLFPAVNLLDSTIVDKIYISHGVKLDPMAKKLLADHGIKIVQSFAPKHLKQTDILAFKNAVESERVAEFKQLLRDDPLLISQYIEFIIISAITNYPKQPLNHPILKHLMKNGITLNQRNTKHKTVLMCASEGTLTPNNDINLQVARFIIENTKQSSSSIRSALSSLKSLFVSKVDPLNLQDREGNTALILASKSGNVEMVRLLLKSGADVEITNSYNESAITYALDLGDAEIMALLTEKGAEITDYSSISVRNTILNLIKKGKVTAIRKILDENIDVDYCDDTLISPLMCACEAQNSDIVLMLLEEYDADINKVDPEGHTAASIALHTGNINILEILIQHHAVFETSDLNEALLIAIQNDNSELVKIVLEQGAEVDSFNQDEATRLMIAVMLGHKNIVDQLLSYEPELKLTNSEGKNLIDLAVEHAPELLETLLIHAAQLEQEDRPLLDYHAKKEIKHIYEKLLDDGYMEGIMTFLLLEIDELISKHKIASSSAEQAAKDLQTNLEEALNKYRASPKAAQDRAELFISWRHHINEAKESSELSHHRGWRKIILTHLALFMIPLLGHLIANFATLYRTGGKHFFYSPITASVEKLETIEQDMKRIDKNLLARGQ